MNKIRNINKNKIVFSIDILVNSDLNHANFYIYPSTVLLLI